MARASREFQVFAKPAGAVCNLDCRYCYYLEKQNLYPGESPHRMPEALLEAYIVQHLDAAPGRVVNFSWHGGEPTILGLDYFRRIVALQRKHQRPGLHITNGMQTNGYLLDENWCRFLSAEGFSVGLSLDGPEDLHDGYRVTRGGKPTHRQAAHAFRLLRRNRIACDVLCVLHDQNVRHPGRVYGYLKDIGARYIAFLPIVEPVPDGTVSPHTVTAEAYGAFLCAVFDEWVRQDVGKITVQIFEEAARPARRMDHSLCIFRETCGDIPVVEHNGDFYCCDHYVDVPHRLGNIQQIPLVDLLESPAQRAFGQAKLDTLPRYCRTCEVRAMCNGGCPKDRFITTPDGEGGLNYLCAGYKRFFNHCLPYTLEVASAGEVGPSPARKTRPVAADTGTPAAAGRNGPCPCGSGLKYKKCCLAR